MTRHSRKTLFLLAETLAVFLSLAALAFAALSLMPAAAAWAAIGVLAVAQGFWFDRMYTVAHEAVHLKLVPGRRRLNDLLGTLLLAPVLAPFTIFRKIHGFHHGANRRDRETAALDHFHLAQGAAPGAGGGLRLLWLFYVFGGGFFLHTLAAILIFLLVPRRLAERISPVFRGWPARQRLRAWGELAIGVALHAAVALVLGGSAWLALLGLPLLAFAWIWSMLLYIYHYRTTVGPDVRNNVRSLPRQPFFSWLLLNFNEHATHHGDPTIPWYALPRHRRALPASHAANDDTGSVLEAIWRQRLGPILWTADRR